MTTVNTSLTLVGLGIILGILLFLVWRKKTTAPKEKHTPKVAMDELLETKHGSSDKLVNRRK